MTLAFLSPIQLPLHPTSTIRKCTQPILSLQIPVPRVSKPLTNDSYLRKQGRESTIQTPNLISDLSSLQYSQSITTDFQSFTQRAIQSLLGNAHIMSSEMESFLPIISRFYASGDMREFIREIANSDLFMKKHFHSVSSTRCVELLYKHLLARAPKSQYEISKAIQILNNNGDGYVILVDRLLDSDEYTCRFSTCLLPSMKHSKEYGTDLRAFLAQVRLQLSDRGANYDQITSTALTNWVITGGNSPGPVEIQTCYKIIVQSYEPTNNWNQPLKSSLVKDWSSAAYIPVDAVRKWNGLASPPRKTGNVDQPWSDGWKPEPTGEKWKSGWAPKTKVYT